MTICSSFWSFSFQAVLSTLISKITHQTGSLFSTFSPILTHRRLIFFVLNWKFSSQWLINTKVKENHSESNHLLSFHILSNFYTYLLLFNQSLWTNFCLISLLYDYLCTAVNCENQSLRSFFVSNLKQYLLFYVKKFVPVLFYYLDEILTLCHQSPISLQFTQSRWVLMFYR